MNNLILAIFIGFASCSGPIPENTHAPESTDTSLLVKGGQALPHRADNVTERNPTLAKLYSKAIVDFIEAIDKEEKTAFDTLFIANRKNGQPDDFPDIDLPVAIGNTKIILLPGSDSEARKSSYRKTSPFINLMGWVEEQHAQFVFVVFYPGFQHQYDCYIDYQYNSNNKEFELEKSRVERVAK